MPCCCCVLSDFRFRDGGRRASRRGIAVDSGFGKQVLSVSNWCFWTVSGSPKGGFNSSTASPQPPRRTPGHTAGTVLIVTSRKSRLEGIIRRYMSVAGCWISRRNGRGVATCLSAESTQNRVDTTADPPPNAGRRVPQRHDYVEIVERSCVNTFLYTYVD